MENYDIFQRSVFQGVDSLYLDNSNCTFFINKDKTGFYVFSMRDGLTPEVKWAQGVRDMDPRNFKGALRSPRDICRGPCEWLQDRVGALRKAFKSIV